MAYGQPYNQQAFTGVQVGVTGGDQYWGHQQQGAPSQPFRGMGTTSCLRSPDRASGRG